MIFCSSDNEDFLSSSAIKMIKIGIDNEEAIAIVPTVPNIKILKYEESGDSSFVTEVSIII